MCGNLLYAATTHFLTVLSETDEMANHSIRVLPKLNLIQSAHEQSCGTCISKEGVGCLFLLSFSYVSKYQHLWTCKAMSSEKTTIEDMPDPSASMIMMDTNDQEFDSAMINEPCSVPVRKKPGRKPNPTSPAIRKAQNRAAQRAFRERKERYLRDLEASVKQMREDRDRLQAENEQFKNDLDILNAENWYLKGIVLTLQLVCFRHHLVLPQHTPYMSKETLTLLSKSIPEPVNAYIHANANNKPPLTVTKEGNTQGNMTTNQYRKRKHRQQYVTTTSICITKDGVQSVPHAGSDFSFPMDESEIDLTSTELSASPTRPPPPSSDLPDSLLSNVAAIQTLRLRLRLQSACAQMESTPFTIQPTTLQVPC